MSKSNKFRKGIKILAATTGVMALLLPFENVSTASQAASPKGKIAFCDFQKAAKESKTGKKMLDDLQSELEKRSKSLEDKKDKLEGLRLELDKKSSVLDDNLKKQKEESYFESRRDLQRLREDVERDLKKKEYESTQEIMNKLREVVNQIGIDEGFDAIFPKETSVYFSKELDITDLVIKKLDRAK
ncbi:MAG: OmpH family outer membrane protein [Nitrospinae bacterium]|nr:OmpH family outer membrane protein [Nitrospinota bacterium]